MQMKHPEIYPSETYENLKKKKISKIKDIEKEKKNDNLFTQFRNLSWQ